MRLSFLTILFALFTSAAFAGVVFEIETRDHEYSPPRIERTRVQAEGVLLVMESNEAQQGRSDTMIFRGDRREMVVVDHERQSYMTIDQQFAANMAGQLNQMAGQMKGMLDNVPPEQRAMVEQMMKDRSPQTQQRARRKLVVRNTGKQDKVYGYSCQLFEVTRDGRKVRDVWVTNWNNISGGRELANTFESMSDFFQEITSALPMQAEAPIEDNVFATMKRLGGFPVATREYRADGTVESESALRSAEQQRIAPASFEPPTGYRHETMFGENRSPARAPSAGQYRQGGR